jgi:LPS export ABC transporter protein LptC
MIEFFMEKIFLVILSLTLFSLLFFMVLRSDKEGKPGVLMKGESFIEGLKIVHRHSGTKDWVLTAKRADIDEKGDKALLTGMEIAIADKGIAVHADKGSYDMNTRRLTVEGKAVAKGDSYSISSEGVEFDGSGGGLKADGGVQIEARKFSVRGTGMDADNNGQTVRIRKNVTAIFHN